MRRPHAAVRPGRSLPAFGAARRGIGMAVGPDRSLRGILPLIGGLALALAIGLLSFASGTAADYVVMQVLSLLLLIPLVFVIQHVNACSGGIVLASFLKLFWISQVAILFFWRPADASLQEPLRTATAITVGAAAAIVGIAAAAFALRPVPRTTMLLKVDSLAHLKALAVGSGVVGFVAQGVWGALSSSMSTASSLNIGSLASGLVVLSYLAPLAILSICTFAAVALIESDGRRLISIPLAVVLMIYMIEVAPLGVKTAPLKPIVALVATAIVFRWKPTPAPLLGGALLLLFVAGFLYPTVNVARLKSMEQRRQLPIVLVEETVSSITDPGYFATIKAKSESYEREIGQSYFGRPVGFLDRFTPLTTDRLVTGSGIVTAQGTGPYLIETVSGLLPRTFGFERDMTGRQARLEAGITRRRMENGKVGWDNTGFVADAYFSGGLETVAITMFLFGLFLTGLARLTFGSGRASVIWIPFFAEYMFAPADITLSAVLPGLIYTWVILSGAIWGLLRISREQPVRRATR